MNAGDEMVRGLRSYEGAVIRHILSNAPQSRPDGDVTPDWIGVITTVLLAERDALAAHVLGLVTAGKAEALREAAKELPGFDGIRTHGDAARWLRDRADGLAGEAS